METLVLDEKKPVVAGDYLRFNHGRIYFAGAERALKGLHWMEGAVRRGNEVASEILEQMGKVQSSSEFMRDLDLKGKKASESYNIFIAKRMPFEVLTMFSNLKKEVDCNIRKITLADLNSIIFGESVPNPL